MKRFNPWLVLCVALTAQNFVYGEAIRQPPSLEAGDQYRLAYLTSWKTTAESSDIEFYNSFVQDNADVAPLGDWGLNWKAIASTETVSARENTDTDPALGIGVPIFLLDGTLLMRNYEALWDVNETGGVARTFDVNEFGTKVLPTPEQMLEDGVGVWTGTSEHGIAFVRPGRGDGALGLGSSASAGQANDLSAGWFNFVTVSTSSQLPLYGISEVLTAVPEPTCSVMLTLAIISITCCGRKKR